MYGVLTHGHIVGNQLCFFFFFFFFFFLPWVGQAVFLLVFKRCASFDVTHRTGK